MLAISVPAVGAKAVSRKVTNQEKDKLMPLLVKRVELTEKKRGFWRLMFQPERSRFYYSATVGNAMPKYPTGATKGFIVDDLIILDRFSFLQFLHSKRLQILVGTIIEFGQSSWISPSTFGNENNHALPGTGKQNAIGVLEI